MFGKLNKKNCYLECNCGCGDGIRLIIDNDEDICYIYTQTSKWSSKQETFLDKLKMAFKILTGKEYILHELIVNKSDLKALQNWLKENI